MVEKGLSFIRDWLKFHGLAKDHCFTTTQKFMSFVLFGFGLEGFCLSLNAFFNWFDGSFAWFIFFLIVLFGVGPIYSAILSLTQALIIMFGGRGTYEHMRHATARLWFGLGLFTVFKLLLLGFWNGANFALYNLGIDILLLGCLFLLQIVILSKINRVNWFTALFSNLLTTLIVGSASIYLLYRTYL